MATRRDPLQTPLGDVLGLYDERWMAPDVEAAIRSAVRAVLPGRQQKKNLTPSLDAARTAFVRTLRRRQAARLNGERKAMQGTVRA